MTDILSKLGLLLLQMVCYKFALLCDVFILTYNTTHQKSL